MKGPARTFTPIHVVELAVPDGYTTLLAVLRGRARVNGSEPIEAAEVALFDRAGERLSIDAEGDSVALLLAGEPIDEPIVGQGPFVMNTTGEIRRAMVDYQTGRMGRLS